MSRVKNELARGNCIGSTEAKDILTSHCADVDEQNLRMFRGALRAAVVDRYDKHDRSQLFRPRRKQVSP